MTSRLLALLSVLTLLVVACGPQETETAGGTSADSTQKVDGRTDAAAEADESDTPTDIPAEVENADLVGLSGSLVDNDFPPDVENCMGVELLKRPSVALALVTAGSDADLATLDLDTQLTVFEILGDCAGPELLGSYFAEEFSSGAEMVDSSDELGACFGEKATDDDGPYMMVALATLGDNQTPPVETQPATIDALTECVSGSVIAESMLADLSADPTFAASADIGCINTAYENADLEPLWTAFVQDPNVDFDTLPAEVSGPLINPVFDCVSIGQLMATEAAATGVTLSSTTIACIDDAAAEAGLMESFVLGIEPDPDVFGEIVLGCLSESERNQLGG